MLDLPLGRYVIVGLANTFGGLILIFSCKALGMGDIQANLLGYGSGILLGFLFNKRWTFAHVGEWGSAFARYLAVLVIAYLANLTTTLSAIEILGVNSYLAQVAGIVPYTLAGYLGARYFAFAPSRGS